MIPLAARGRGRSAPGERFETAMRECLRLAARARGRTSPNPMVGALLIRGGRVVARGWHRAAGQPHAEAVALAELGTRARGATLVTNLEPCAHHGRTPPCADAILRAGVARGDGGMLDPDPRVRGRGARRLRAAGVRVDVGVLERECRALNEAFVTAMTRRRPLTTLKAAVTLDGRIAAAGGDSRWITGPEARAEAHRLRGAHDAVLVGARTARRDDPLLTVRHGRGNGGSSRERSSVPGRQPIRVVLDGHLTTRPSARMLREPGGGPVWIATSPSPPAARARALEAAGAVLLKLPSRGARIDIRALGRALVAHGVRSLLVEGGGETHAAFLEAGAADRVVWFVAPKILGGARAVPSVGGRGAARVADAVLLDDVTVGRAGDAIVVRGRVHRDR